MAAAFEEFAEGLNHPEGVCWNPSDGRVYAGGESGEIYAVTLEGDVDVVATTGGSMLGLAADGRGRIYACDEGNGEVVRVDPGTGAVEMYARGPGGAVLDTPNMLAFDGAGRCFVTCSGEDGDASIVRIDPDRTVTVWTSAVPAYPNGICLDAGGEALVVVESHRPALVRVPLASDGSAGIPRVIALLPDTEPDGVTLGADGGYYVTLYRPDGIVRVDATGEVTPVVHDPLAHVFDAPTNLAFVGPALDRAVVANVGDRFLSIGDVGTTGAALMYPEGL
jgi:sugar lactone lactonase YvrE